MEQTIAKVVERWLQTALPGEVWRLNANVSVNQLSFLHTSNDIHVVDELTLPHECACYQPVIMVCPRFYGKAYALIDGYRAQGLPVLLITRSSVYVDCDVDHTTSL